MSELLGTGQCVVRGCTSLEARYTLDKNGFAVCTDKKKGGCGGQYFSRDPEADELFRDCLASTPRPTARPADPAPAPAVHADPPGPIAKTDDADQDNNPPPPPARTGLAWGILS